MYFLSTGASAVKTTVRRKLKSGDSTQIACPTLVDTYNKGMGGVDTNDQLRLQRYSLQRGQSHATLIPETLDSPTLSRAISRAATVQKKYYRTLFTGLVDMALVNAYIVKRAVADAKSEPRPSHADFLLDLQARLVRVQRDEFRDGFVRGYDDDDDDESDDDDSSQPRSSRNPGHVMAVTSDFIASGRRRRTRVCKVCFVLTDPGERVHETSVYCETCSTSKANVFLCNKVRRVSLGTQLTCFQIWHSCWANGTQIPTARKGQNFRIRMRGQRAGDDDDAGDASDPTTVPATTVPATSVPPAAASTATTVPATSAAPSVSLLSVLEDMSDDDDDDDAVVSTAPIVATTSAPIVPSTLCRLQVFLLRRACPPM